MTEIDQAAAAERAERLLEAARNRRPIAPFTDARTTMTAADGYAVQREVVRRRLAGGETIIGWKLGLTSAAMQQQLGVDQPDYGPLLTGHPVDGEDPVSTSGLIAPRIEAEIAFRLARPLRGPGISPAEARAAIEAVGPSLEIIDSRIADWRIQLPDTIADMASSARIVIGPMRPPDDIDLAAVRAVVSRNGEPVAEGLGAAVLGDPVLALAWAANTLGQLAVTLEPGQVIMPGAMHASLPVAAGDTFEAVFDPLGTVSVRFVE
jgi:2-keto-4-pentenoate hydratase